MPEQRNRYEGFPQRPVLFIELHSRRAQPLRVKLLVDTGNPYSLVISDNLLTEYGGQPAFGTITNFGSMNAAWMRLRIPELGFDRRLVVYSNAEVVEAVKRSKPDFDGLAGLPLLRRLEYGGNSDSFWLRTD